MSVLGEETASERNRRVTQLVVKAGSNLGLSSETEYPIVGGRVDVVWLWDGPAAFPIRLPLVGFEIESSWRSRKHIKGDVMNLVDLQPSLGVIVLLGEGPDVESVRRFTRDLVDRHATRIEVWSEAEVNSLHEERVRVEELLGDVAVESPPEVLEEGRIAVQHAGKYRRLAQWLASQRLDVVDLSFQELEEILGFPLPPSSRNHLPHWHGYRGSAVARAIIDAGWRARNVNLTAERVTLFREAGN